MSITVLNAPHSYGYLAEELPAARHVGQAGAAEASAAFQAAKEVAIAAAARMESSEAAGAPWRMCGTPSAENAQLQEKVWTIKNAENAVKALVDRMRSDPSLGPRSEAAKQVGTLQAAFDFVVSETKKSGLYGTLQKAAIERLKDSGSYEDLIRQVLEKENALGSTRDRAWAENWIEGQFDYDRVDADHRAGNPYFQLSAAHGEARALPGNKGTGAFFGNKSDIHAQGAFSIEFSGTAKQPLYTVENRITGEKTTPRPFDSRGTVIEADGLRAEMFGAPAPGDAFSIYKPSNGSAKESEYHVAYPDSFFTASPQNRKIDLFNSLFGPAIGENGEKAPSKIIRDFVYTPV